MDDVLRKVLEWLERGEEAALATIVAVERKAPRGPGATMAVGPRREIVGSLSGGCVEPAVVEAASDVLRRGEARIVSFGITDDHAFGVGLSCGGTLHVLVEPIGAGGAERELLEAIARAEAAGEATALVTVLGGGRRAKLLVPEDPAGDARGSTGDPRVDGALADVARALLARGISERRQIDGLDVFVRSLHPPAVLYVVGAVHPAAELCRAARLVGYRVVVCDPRSPFATPERLPDADEIAREWPDAFLGARRIGPRDAVCVLTHDLKFDVPALRAALRGGAGWVGAMGSRKTHARRIERLRAEGVGEEEIGRVSSPVGLDLGGEDPGEIAVAIVAELVAHRRGKLASLRSGGGDEPGRVAPGARPGRGGREGGRAPDGDRGSA